MSTHISCKKFYGLHGTEDLREKLILDYEKLYYRVYELKLFQKQTQKENHTLLINDYHSKMQYISYLFMYIYDMSINKFINLKNIEEKVETYHKSRNSNELPENWLEIYENNNYQSIKF